MPGHLISLKDALFFYQQTKSNANTNNANTVFIDGSWHLSKDRNARTDYEQGPRIAGALFFDIDDVASKGPILNPKSLPHMMPPKVMFILVVLSIVIVQ